MYIKLYLQLNEHLSVKGGDCPLHVILCPFNKLGCSYEVSTQIECHGNN